MKEIALTRGLVALVDDENFEWLNRYKWWASSTGYACRKETDPSRKSGRRQIYMHREVLGIVDAPKVIADHADGNRLNNQRANLRSCNVSQNGINRGVSVQSESGLKCVSRYKGQDRWYAYIQMDGRQKFLGLFDSPQEAHAAYCDAGRKVYGEFFHAG